jgi:hypothetical protein
MKSIAMNRSTNALQIIRYIEEPPKLNGNVDLFMRKGYDSFGSNLIGLAMDRNSCFSCPNMEIETYC